jgi:hypothetical protein
MGMPNSAATDDRWTVEMLDALPEDGQRYEIIDGELYVTPAASDVHQLVAAEFWMRIHVAAGGNACAARDRSTGAVRRRAGVATARLQVNGTPPARALLAAKLRR